MAGLAGIVLATLGAVGFLACRVHHHSNTTPPSRLRVASPVKVNHVAAEGDAAPATVVPTGGEPFDIIVETDGPLVGGATVRLRFGGHANVKLSSFRARATIPSDIGGSQWAPDRPVALEAGQVVDRVTVVKIPPDDIERCIEVRARGDGTTKVAYLPVNAGGRPRVTRRLEGRTSIDIDLVASEPLRPDGIVDLTLQIAKLPPPFTAKLSFTLPEGAELLSQPADPTECSSTTPTCAATIHVRLPRRPGFTVRGDLYISYLGRGTLELSDSPGCGQ